MIEEMTKERAFSILGLPMDADFSTTSLAFRNLRDKYHPDTNPRMRREYTEVLAAFEFLQRMFSD
jgi:DnaJ-class molecular chaperone